jgi:hypothetical protein
MLCNCTRLNGKFRNILQNSTPNKHFQDQSEKILCRFPNNYPLFLPYQFPSILTRSIYHFTITFNIQPSISNHNPTQSSRRILPIFHFCPPSQTQFPSRFLNLTQWTPHLTTLVKHISKCNYLISYLNKQSFLSISELTYNLFFLCLLLI